MTHPLPVVTNSQLTVFRRCQREHYYAYVLGYRARVDVEALRFGTCWHRGLEAWWLGQGLEAAIKAATASALDAFEAARLRVLLRGYDARWGSEVHDVVSVEQEFRVPLLNPWTGDASRYYEFAGKLDVLLGDRFVESKTSSEDIGLGSIYWRRLTLDPQISAYYVGAASLGHPVRGCIYDVVRKLAVRPLKARPVVDDEGVKVVVDGAGMRVRTRDDKAWRQTGDLALGYRLLTRDETPEEYELRCSVEVAAHPDKYYQRGEVVRLEADERDAALDVWHLVEAMREGIVLDRFPRNPDACLRYNRICPYFDVCTRVASLEDSGRFERVENVHPELTGRV